MLFELQRRGKLDKSGFKYVSNFLSKKCFLESYTAREGNAFGSHNNTKKKNKTAAQVTFSGQWGNTNIMALLVINN